MAALLVAGDRQVMKSRGKLSARIAAQPLLYQDRSSQRALPFRRASIENVRHADIGEDNRFVQTTGARHTNSEIYRLLQQTRCFTVALLTLPHCLQTLQRSPD